MMYSKNSITRVVANVSLTVPLVCGLYLGFLFLQRLQLPTDVYGEHIITPQPVVPGQVVDVGFTVVRRSSCVLGISRVIEQADDDYREYEIGFLTQVIDADVPPYPRQAGYRVQIPLELNSGTYKLFSRYRYYCNGLDLWSPWVRRTKPVTIEVKAP